ncbi:hypothetical protein KIN20_014071 [Parelaphostrongylus tenuis]|uniref:Uncharacterized protein n=1 Tax=Parelaphostrongylus tenuis TaxID=148309 RepID=A0AAD5QLF1_PARTN|nr:hypothetical protein KIN20_014071 [Parelaphostrongylus tenuis]
MAADLNPSMNLKEDIKSFRFKEKRLLLRTDANLLQNDDKKAWTMVVVYTLRIVTAELQHCEDSHWQGGLHRLPHERRRDAASCQWTVVQGFKNFVLSVPSSLSNPPCDLMESIAVSVIIAVVSVSYSAGFMKNRP